MRNMHRDGERAFTLLEVMVALAILSFGILGVVAMFTTAIGGNSQGRNLTEAATLAQSKLDDLATGVPYNNLANGSASGIQPDPYSGVTYNTRWIINNSFSPLQMTQITVIVTWTTKGENHSVQYDTLRAKD